MNRVINFNRKVRILLTLIFSFLFFSLSLSKVKAIDTEIVQEQINITSVVRDNNTIIVTTTRPYAFKHVSYSIVYYDIYKGEKAKVADLKLEQQINKVDNHTFTFDVDSSILGVRIYKIGYDRGNGDIADKAAIGRVSVGDINSVAKKNFISVTTDSLVSGNICNNSEALGDILDSNNCDTYYMFYFNLDTEVDEIIDLSFKYKIKTVKKDWIWSGSYENISDWIRVKVNHEETVTNYSYIEQFLEAFVMSKCRFDKSCYVSNKAVFNDEYNRLKAEAQIPVLGPDDRGVYNWYIQPLKNLTLTDNSSWFGQVYEKEYLQELAVIEMSYYVEGEYFENIPVYDEDTGEVFVHHEKSLLEKIKDWFNNLLDVIKNNAWKAFWIILGIIVCVVLTILVIKLGIKLTFKLLVSIIKGFFIVLWKVLKWTIFLPITLIVRSIKKEEDDY